MNELLLLALLVASPGGPTAFAPDTTRPAAEADSAGRNTTSTDPLVVTPAGLPHVSRLPLVSVVGNPVGVAGDVAPGDQGRPRAISYSDWYNRRLVIHRLGSYAMLPLFATEYWLGNKLMNDLELASWVRPAHGTVASGIGVLFAVNTVTGVWNLWDARHDDADRTRRTIHAVAMLAADAGFLWTASLADDDEGESTNAQPHKNAALASIGISTLGTAMMWLWKK